MPVKHLNYFLKISFGFRGDIFVQNVPYLMNNEKYLSGVGKVTCLQHDGNSNLRNIEIFDTVEQKS